MNMSDSNTTIDKKSLVICVGCYAMWGSLAAYWQLLRGVDPLLVLCARIVFSFAFSAILLGITRSVKLFIGTLLDKTRIIWLIPASVLITINYGIYIWAVNSAHVVESSLGYYINPLIVFLLGVLLFREKFTRMQFVAVVLAFVGVLISVIAYGVFPFISFGLALTFAAYGAIKKKANVDPLSGIAIEALLITPFALAFALVFRMDGISALSAAEAVLMVLSGVVTATPLVLYSRSVNHIPFYVVGFAQYVSPSILLVYGILSGETLTMAQLISFVFIGLGLIVFSIAMVKNK